MKKRRPLKIFRGFSPIFAYSKVKREKEAVTVGDGELIDRLRRREQSGLEELSRRYGPLMRYILSPHPAG